MTTNLILCLLPYKLETLVVLCRLNANGFLVDKTIVTE
jgi:hypothetical protein